MSSVANADAVLSALAAGGVETYERSTAPEWRSGTAYSYAVVDSDLGRGETYRLNGRSKVTGYRVPVQCIGSSENNARYVADKVLAALAGARLSVAATLCTPARLESSTPVRRDDTDVANAYIGTLVFAFASTPSA